MDDVDAYTKLVLHQVDSVLVELVQERAGLILREMFKASLKDAAAIGVS